MKSIIERYPLVSMLFLLFLLAPSTTHGALWEEIPFEKMVKRADLIIIGTIEDIAEERLVEHPDPELDYYYGYTDWNINVLSYLKGADLGDTVLVTTPGVEGPITDEDKNVRMLSSYYRLDRIVNSIENELGIEAAEVLFFLEERDGFWEPITPKAVVPLAILDWEEYLTPELVGEEEIDLEHESFQELIFLREYVDHAKNSGGEEVSHSRLMVYIVGCIALLILLVFFVNKKIKYQ
ncbi:MAG: hypothetical protein LRY73_00455 [Bacillus sp. (in: Bacteria)]|nr:hypothetical protein [Bacillus sp. (in: firmicutes)]